MADCTVIIPTWKRAKNFNDLLASIKMQTVATEIHVWDNGATTDNPVAADPRIDLLMRCPRNWGSWVRFPAMAFVRTPYAWQMDDDLLFSNADVLERYIAESKSFGDAWVISAGGRKFGAPPKAYQSGVGAQPGPATMVNTGFTLFPMGLVQRIPLNPIYCNKPISDAMLLNCDDPWVSAFLPTRVTAIPLDGNQWHGIVRGDECGLGVSHMTGAMSRRDEICEQYLRDKEARMAAGANE